MSVQRTITTRPVDANDPHGHNIEQVGDLVAGVDGALAVVTSRNPVGAEWRLGCATDPRRDVEG